MKVLIAVDKFKGSLTQTQATAAIEAGIKRVYADAEIIRCPLADGGEGTVETIIAAAGGRLEYFDVCGPLPGTKVKAPVGFLPDGTTAIVELASASGMILLSPDQRDPTRTTTFGTGELMKHAADRGAKTIILGIGGSATNDAGLGLAQAWGGAVKLTNGKVYTAQDRKLCGNDLGQVTGISKFGPTFTGYTYARPGEEENRAILDTRGVEFIVACDVGNPLFGPDGAAHVFAPQKGATPEQVEQLDADLRKLVDRLQLPVTAQSPGAGAAGGAGFALMAFFGAKMVSGADLILELSKLKEKIAGVDLVITGEGRLDGQTLAGKAPVSVSRACKEANVPCIAIGGSIGPGAEGLLEEGMHSYFAITPRPMPLSEAMEDAAMLLEDTTSRIVRVMGLKLR